MRNGGVFDPKFKYVPASQHETADGLKARFRKVRRELERERQAQERPREVLTLKRSAR